MPFLNISGDGEHSIESGVTHSDSFVFSFKLHYSPSQEYLRLGIVDKEGRQDVFFIDVDELKTLIDSNVERRTK